MKNVPKRKYNKITMGPTRIKKPTFECFLKIIFDFFKTLICGDLSYVFLYLLMETFLVIENISHDWMINPVMDFKTIIHEYISHDWMSKSHR